MPVSRPTLTLPAVAAAYAAGDVVGGAFEFTGIPKPGKEFLLVRGSLVIGANAIPAGMTSFRQHLYTRTPPSAIADNAAWSLTAADRPYYIGYYDYGSPADVGDSLHVQTPQINDLFPAYDSGLFGYLVTNGAYTPAAASELYYPGVRFVWA